MWINTPPALRNEQHHLAKLLADSIMYSSYSGLTVYRITCQCVKLMKFPSLTGMFKIKLLEDAFGPCEYHTQHSTWSEI